MLYVTTWGGSIAEAFCFLAEGRGAICNHPDPMGCVLPVSEAPSCLTSCKPKYSTRLCGSFIWTCWLFAGLTPPTRTEDQPGAVGSKACWLGGSAWWERVDVFQLVRVLLTVLACRMIHYRFGNVDDGVGTAAPERCWGRRRRRRVALPLSPPPLTVLGAAQAPNCKASLIAPFHYLCSKLTDTAPSGMRETCKEPSREYPSSTTEARFFRCTYTYF